MSKKVKKADRPVIDRITRADGEIDLSYYDLIKSATSCCRLN